MDAVPAASPAAPPPAPSSAYPADLAMGEVDYSNLPYIISLFVLILSLLIFILWRKTKSGRTHVLIAGLSDAGKTALFSQLLFAEPKETFSSITVNAGFFSGNDAEQSTVRVVDIPGSERLRGRFFDQFKYVAKGVVYVIDSCTAQREIRDVADFLYTILSDNGTAATPILIVCNKQDDALAKGAAAIRPLLEKELNVVRQTRTNRLQSVDGGANAGGGNDNVAFLGRAGKDFAFTHLAQDVQVVEASARDGELGEVVQWLRRL